jgi:UDP-N-acetylmuramyl pentapeptide synthase
MGEESKNIHYKIGQQLSSSGIENIVLIENSVTKEIEKGLKDNGFQGNLIWFKEMNFFFREMPHITVSGDLVLIQNDWSDQYK